MEDELYNCLMSEINGNHLYQKQAYETLTDINQLRQMETLPRWDDVKSFLGKCWREAFSHPATIIFDFFCSLSQALPFVSVVVRGKEDEG